MGAAMPRSIRLSVEERLLIIITVISKLIMSKGSYCQK